MNSSVQGNSATQSGGGIWNSGFATLTIGGTSVAQNTAPDGGGIANYEAALNLDSSSVQHNTADVHGGGIYYDPYVGTIHQSDSVIKHNSPDDIYPS